MERFWNEVEAAPRERIEEVQWSRLQEVLRWTFERVPFYREKLLQEGVRPERISSLEDLQQLPFTTKSDLRYQYPLGLCAIERGEVLLFQATSGSTGQPVIVPYGRQDLEIWAECMARALWAAGVRSEDICQNAYCYGLFTGGLGYHYGAQRIGCAVIPASSGFTERQVVLLRDLGATVLFCTPSYALTIAEYAEEFGVNLRELPLRIGHFGAEPCSVKMRDEIEERMGIEAYEMYGLTEIVGPGVAFSCQYRQLHINEDYFYPEVIDPVTEKVLPEGEEGELVLTSLGRRAMPLLRYRTGDLTALRRGRCRCGRTLVRMERILGRTDDMLIVSGVKVFPSQVEGVLLGFTELEPHYRIRISKKGYVDAMAVEVEVKGEIYAAEARRAALERQVAEKLRQVVGVKVPVSLLPPGALPRSEGKANRVVYEGSGCEGGTGLQGRPPEGSRGTGHRAEGRGD